MVGRRRGRVALLAMLLATIAGVLGTWSAASAHAELESSSPTAGAVLADVAEPDHADVQRGRRRVARLDPRRRRRRHRGVRRVDHAERRQVDAWPPTCRRWPTARTSSRWKAISADSHPVAGAFTFSVGSPSTTNPDLINDLLTSSQPAKADAGMAGDRQVVELRRHCRDDRRDVGARGDLVDGSAHPPGDDPARRRRHRGRARNGPDDLGAGGRERRFVDGLERGDRHPVRQVVAGPPRRRRRRLPRGDAPSAAAPHDRVAAHRLARRPVLLLAVVAAGGHAVTGRWVVLGVAATVAHLGAMAVWLGGLAAIAATVPRQRMLRMATAFSPIALGRRRRPRRERDDQRVAPIRDRGTHSCTAATARG